MKTKLIPYKEIRAKWFKDPKFVKAYHALDEEFALIRQVLDQRIRKDITQKELAEKMGTRQSAISRIEAGNANPSIGFLKKMAKALDCRLEIKFVPLTS